MPIDAVELQALGQLYEQGLYLQAYRRAEPFGPLPRWTGTAARIFAGRLAGNLGAPRLSQALHYLAWRDDPTDPTAIYYHAHQVVHRRGPLAGWELQEKYRDLPDADPQVRGWFCALRALTLGQLRDFDAAESWMKRAETWAPADPWIQVERSSLHVMQDRYEQALAVARAVLSAFRWFRPAVQMVGELLQIQGEDEAARDFLLEAGSHLESYAIAAQLAVLYRDLGEHEATEQWLATAAQLALLAEPALRDWFTYMTADAAYFGGNAHRSLELTRRYATPAFRRHADRMNQLNWDGRRVQLPVKFVRQHHMTCAPATLTAISRFWNVSVDQSAIVEEICYDGTPGYLERQWADRNGWITREFTVTLDSAIALLDRGVPFTLATVTPGNAHLQAVIGYDTRRGTLLLRDPYHHHIIEVAAAPLFEHQRFSGPRGLVLVPADRSALLDGLDLPDAVLHDLHHQVNAALGHHDRGAAQRAYEQLTSADQEHRITRHARLSMACYDGDPTSQLRCLDQLLLAFPQEPLFLLGRISCLRVLGRRADRLELLEQLRRAGCDPLLLEEYAEELIQDPAQDEAARTMLRDSIQARPQRGDGFRLLANLHWRRREFESALTLYRFAACVGEKQERFALAYFRASRFLRKTELGLDFLRRRFARFGKHSGEPAQSLYTALKELDRIAEGLEVLQEALRLRPEDGDLLLFTANACAASGQNATADACLQRAHGQCHPAAWLRAMADQAWRRGQLPEALELWRQVLDAEPVAIDAHRAVGRLLASLEGPAAAARHVEAAAERYPHCYPIHQFRIEQLRDDPVAAEKAVRRLIEIDPADTWAHRELAFILLRLNRVSAGLAEAQVAVTLDPSDCYSVTLLGQAQLDAGQVAQARENFQQAVRLSVDHDRPFRLLLRLCATPQEKKDVLAFLHDQLMEQVVFGNSLLVYQECAQGILSPGELLDWLREANRIRIDLWESWAALCRQLLAMNQLDEALTIARQATERFPLVPSVWYELAGVHVARQETAERIAALQQFLVIQPDADVVARLLARVQQEAGQAAAARALMEQAAARHPLDVENHLLLADLMWNEGQREEAVHRVQHALRLEPDTREAWQKLQTWDRERGTPAATADFARALTTERPHDPQTWFVLAHVLTENEQLDERLAAVRKTLALNPPFVEAHDLHAELLLDAGRFDEALAACRPAAFPDEVPYPLRGREACVLAARQDFASAIRLMTGIVQQHPDYLFGWYRLVEWYDALNQPREGLEAANRWLLIQPDAVMALGYRGSFRQALGDRPAAKTDLARALDLDPDYAFAAYQLSCMRLEDGELTAAAESIALLRRQPNHDWMALETWLAVEHRDWPAVGLKLDELYRAGADVDRHLGWLSETLIKNNGRVVLKQALQRSLEQPQISPSVAREWARICVPTLPRRKCWRLLQERRAQNDAGWEATAAYVGTLGRPQSSLFLRWFVHRYGSELARDRRTWYSVGLALNSAGLARRTLRWMSDWKARADVSSADLLVLALAFRAVRRPARAAELHQHALTLPADSATPCHHAWLAFDTAREGHPQASTQHLEHVPAAPDTAYYQFLREMIQAILAVQSAGPRDRAAYQQSRAHERAALSAQPGFKRIPSARRVYLQALARIARDSRLLTAHFHHLATRLTL